MLLGDLPFLVMMVQRYNFLTTRRIESDEKVFANNGISWTKIHFKL